MPSTAKPPIHATCRHFAGRLFAFLVVGFCCDSVVVARPQGTVEAKSLETVEVQETVPEVPVVAKESTKSDKFADLLAGDLSKNWKSFSSKEDAPFASVWKLDVVAGERELVCTGAPKGFLFTRKTYSNFELEFEWKYVSDANGNSGVLVFTKDEPRLWPTSMQIQLHQPLAGCIFPSGDAISDNTTEAKDLALEIGKWNTCRVRAEGGKLKVSINGKTAGEVSGCNPEAGSIALQSEGSETRFRRMKIFELPAVATPVAEPVVEPVADEPAKEKSTAVSEETPTAVDQ